MMIYNQSIWSSSSLTSHELSFHSISTQSTLLQPIDESDNSADDCCAVQVRFQQFSSQARRPLSSKERLAALWAHNDRSLEGYSHSKAEKHFCFHTPPHLYLFMIPCASVFYTSSSSFSFFHDFCSCSFSYFYHLSSSLFSHLLLLHIFP